MTQLYYSKHHVLYAYHVRPHALLVEIKWASAKNFSKTWHTGSLSHRITGQEPLICTELCPPPTPSPHVVVFLEKGDGQLLKAPLTGGYWLAGLNGITDMVFTMCHIYHISHYKQADKSIANIIGIYALLYKNTTSCDIWCYISKYNSTWKNSFLSA